MLKIIKYTKTYCITVLIFLNLYSLTACTSSTNQTFKDEEILQVQIKESDENSMKNSKLNIDENLLINIQVENKSYTGVLYNNSSSQGLLKVMPMTINMNDMNSNEKFYYLPEKLPTNSERIGKINIGDIMLFGSDCLVLFYETFSTSYSYTKIGYIEDASELKDVLGNGSIKITFDINKE